MLEELKKLEKKMNKIERRHAMADKQDIVQARLVKSAHATQKKIEELKRRVERGG